jgi:hypothetical protein
MLVNSTTFNHLHVQQTLLLAARWTLLQQLMLVNQCVTDSPRRV